MNINGKWGVICGDHWTMKNTMVVCRQLGLGYAAANYSTAHYGRTGKIFLSGITCLGHESSLDECLRHDNLTCSQTKRIAAVKCQESKYVILCLWFGLIRLGIQRGEIRSTSQSGRCKGIPVSFIMPFNFH